MASMICDATVDHRNQSCAIFRVSETNINVYTKNRLTDEQMQDLYWVCSLMTKTGLTLKDLFKDTISSNDARNLMHYTSKDKSKEKIK